MVDDRTWTTSIILWNKLWKDLATAPVFPSNARLENYSPLSDSFTLQIENLVSFPALAAQFCFLPREFSKLSIYLSFLLLKILSIYLPNLLLIIGLWKWTYEHNWHFKIWLSFTVFVSLEEQFFPQRIIC